MNVNDCLIIFEMYFQVYLKVSLNSRLKIQRWLFTDSLARANSCCLYFYQLSETKVDFDTIPIYFYTRNCLDKPSRKSRGVFFLKLRRSR